MKYSLYLIFGISWLLQLTLTAELKPAFIFQDGAVLQRDKPIAVWGRDVPGTTVTASLGQDSARGVTDDRGFWRVTLPAQEANPTPQSLVIEGSSTYRISDILIGEVWLVSGQSNMEWRVSNSLDEEIVTASARYPHIREIKIGRVSTPEPQWSAPGEWRAAIPENVGGFSAVAYAFARDIHRITDLPVGIIHSAWGGSPIHVWMTPESLAEPQFNQIIKNYERWLANRQPDDRPQWIPASLYNGMIHPIAPFTLRGFLWYQGESDVGNAADYPARKARMIEDWRSVFEDPELPFFWVQLSSFGGNSGQTADNFNWGYMREAQSKVLAIPHTGQILSYDVGDVRDIHPLDKETLGRRFARLALNQIHGFTNFLYRGPEAVNFERIDDKIKVTFDHAPRGLRTPGRSVEGFDLAGPDRVFHPATGEIKENTVLVSSPAVSEPVALRYGWRNATPANLYNHRMLPALPFRTDDWERQ